MKQIKTIIAIAIFSALNFTNVNAADTTESRTSLPVELKFAGTFRNQPLVQLNFTGSTEDRVYRISIKDEEGVELYNADVKGDVFSKQFLLNTDDLGETTTLEFEITGRTSGKTAVYKVSRHTKVSQQMDVVKL